MQRLLKRIKENVHSGQIDFELENRYKKHRNYCHSLIKKAVREKAGGNITSEPNVTQVWRNVNDILKPDNLVRQSIKIEEANELIEDPKCLAEKLNVFFKEKVDKLAEGIKQDLNNDPFLQLKEKMSDSKLKFN